MAAVLTLQGPERTIAPPCGPHPARHGGRLRTGRYGRERLRRRVRPMSRRAISMRARWSGGKWRAALTAVVTTAAAAAMAVTLGTAPAGAETRNRG